MKYVSPTKAMDHQRAALAARAARPPGYADVFADQAEMGCGKTKVILNEWQEMISRGEIEGLLVVAPKGCLRNWHADKSETQLSELRTHLDPRLLKKLEMIVWSSGVKARKRAFDQLCATGPRALFVNIEALSTNQLAIDLCKQFLMSGSAMMVLDESTTIRAKASERTKVITKILGPLAKVRRIMTGLMTPKSPLDLFWQFYFLDPKVIGYGDDYVAFRARYAKTKIVSFESINIIRDRLRHVLGINRTCTPDYLRERLSMAYDGARKINPKMPLKKVVEELEIIADGMSREQAVATILRMGSWIKSHTEISEYRNLEELRAKIAPFSHRVLKKDCMDLPPKIYMPPREVELTSHQQKMYDEMKAKCVAELEGQHVVASTVLAQMMRLHQIALGHVKDEDGNVFDIPSNRVKALIEILEDRQGKVIIWSYYQREIAKIVAALQKEYGPDSVAEFHGGNARTRGDDESRFLTDPRCEFLVSSQAAGGRGNTWNAAGFAVYCSNTYDLELRLQSEDRNHRKGQTSDKVTYLDFYVPGTVEEKIIHALRNKINLATEINGENYREWLI